MGGSPAGASAVNTVGGAFGPRGACFDCHTIFRTPTIRFTPVNLPGDFLSRGAFDHSVREHRVDRQGQPSCNQCHAAATSGSATDLLLPVDTESQANTSDARPYKRGIVLEMGAPALAAPLA